MATHKSYQYKVYRGGAYLGLLEPVTSVFKYSQDINSPGSSLRVTVGASFDVANQRITTIDDEDSLSIRDEDNNSLFEERSPDVVGSFSESIMLRTGNLVEVYEFSDYHVNGKKVFSGIINRLEASFGEASPKDSIVALLYSRGSELDNYIVEDNF